MSDRARFHRQLDEVERLASGGRWSRFWRKPLNYLTAIGHRKVVYPRHREPYSATVDLFFGESLHLLLPASTDIYLTGGKSHDSEIRLARLLINTLQPGDVFVDIGAHYGYFASLAAALLGPSGKVLAIEAAPATFAVLARNAATRPTIQVEHLALGSQSGELTFYEFPHAYGEYNSFDVEQYKSQAWFVRQQPRAIQVPANTLDALLAAHVGIAPPRLIKIDVEGGEAQVLRGATNTIFAKIDLLKSASNSASESQDESPKSTATRSITDSAKHARTVEAPLIVMEYLNASRGNQAHREAEAILRAAHYLPNAISAKGDLLPIQDVADYFATLGIDSDNIAFHRV